MILIVYISAGIFSVVENTMLQPNYYVVNSDLNQSDIYCELCIDYHDSIYFLIVSLTTVGYGDLNPESFPARIVVIVIILITIVIIPKQIDDLIRLINMYSSYSTDSYKSAEVRHIVVTGYIGY